MIIERTTNVDNFNYDEYVTDLVKSRTAHRLADAAKSSAEDTIRKSVDFSGSACLYCFAGTMFGIGFSTDIQRIENWIILAICLLSAAVAVIYAARIERISKQKLHEELTRMYYSRYIQSCVIKDAAYEFDAVDAKAVKDTVDSIHTDIRITWILDE